MRRALADGGVRSDDAALYLRVATWLVLGNPERALFAATGVEPDRVRDVLATVRLALDDVDSAEFSMLAKRYAANWDTLRGFARG